MAEETAEGQEAGVQAKRSVTPAPNTATITQNCGPIERGAKHVGWLKTMVAAALALLAGGAGAAMYADTFATDAEVKAVVGEMEKSHSAVGHPETQRDLRDIQDRLIRVETVQQRMDGRQQSMDYKLDTMMGRLLGTQPLPPPPLSQNVWSPAAPQSATDPVAP